MNTYSFYCLTAIDLKPYIYSRALQRITYTRMKSIYHGLNILYACQHIPLYMGGILLHYNRCVMTIVYSVINEASINTYSMIDDKVQSYAAVTSVLRDYLQ